MTQPGTLPLESQRPPLWQAALWAVGTSVFFLVVYSGCNWVAWKRTSVGILSFDWERRIPFVPMMIVPYMSIDLFFFFSPFLCRNRRELRAHGLRLLLAMCIAAVFFLLFPLRMEYTHPPVHGLFGLLFSVLGGFDRPFNLVPSLHIALLVLLWIVYVGQTRGMVQSVLRVWFALIALSAVLTYQHHVIDVVTGFALGLLCLFLIPVPKPVRADRPDSVASEVTS